MTDNELYKEINDEFLDDEGEARAREDTISSGDDSTRVEFLELLFQLSITLSK